MKPGLARVSLLWIVILVLFALPGCQSEPPQPAPTPAPPALTPMPGSPSSPTVPDPDYWPTGTWITSIPERQGMDSAELAAMFDDIEQRDLNLHSLLIIRNGYIVTEAYFVPNSDLVKQQVASVTKASPGC